MEDTPPYTIVEAGEPEDEAVDGLPDSFLPGDEERVEALPVLLDKNRRQHFLGRLAEFEMMLVAMPDRMQGFCLAYIANPSDAGAAARKAGYSHRSAVVRASQLLVRSDVQAVLALGFQLREDRTMLTSDRTLNELAIIAFSSIGDYAIHPESQAIETREGVPEYALRAVASAEFTSTSRETRDGGTVTEYKTKIKLWPKTEALRLLATYQKLLVEGAPTINIQNNDNRGQVHNHQHNTWMVGGQVLRF